jgi:NAD-dependent SIR2 family protein deacetylase
MSELVTALKCEKCGTTYPSKYHFYAEGETSPTICTTCYKSRPSAEWSFQGKKAGARHAAMPEEREEKRARYVRNALIVASVCSIAAFAILKFDLLDKHGIIGGILGIVAFYAWIQVFSPGEMVGQYYLIRCPHCGWSNNIAKVPDPTLVDPFRDCDSCHKKFRWIKE